MTIFRKTVIGILLVFIPLTTTAQNLLKVNGTVKDSEGFSVISAVVKQTDNKNNAVVTDQDGNFKIIVPKDKSIEISCLGYISKTIKITEKTKNLDIVLEVDTQTIEELVVIGYGTQKKSDLTGAVGLTNVVELQKAPVSSVDQAMAGRIAGVQVTSGDEQPGSSMNIVIRGGNSLTQSNSPLYVIDGFPMLDFSMASLNPQDIKSISILKDASATAIYGSRGANGVIIIETQTGNEGRTTVSYDGYVGIAAAAKRMEMMSPYEFVQYQLEVNPSYVNSSYLKDGKTLEDYRNIKGIDWQDQLFRNALIHNHSLSVRGGSKRTTFNASLSYTDHQGVIINSGYNRYRGRIQLNHKFNDRIRINVAADYSKDKAYGDIASQSSNTTQQYAGYLMYRTWGSRPITGVGEESLDELLYDPDALSIDTRFNPIVDTRNSDRKKNGSYVHFNANASFLILPELELTIKGGIYNRIWRETSYYNSQTSRGSSLLASNTKGVNGNVNFREARSFLNENTLKYHKKFKKRHDFTALAGWTIQSDNKDIWEFGGENLLIEQLGISGIDNGTPSAVKAVISGNRMMSFLTRVNYNYADRYLVTASFRADGSSKFSKANRWGYFPSAAFAWNISNEKFMKKASHVINLLKLRISYGETGNDRIGDFSRFSSMNSSYSNYYSFKNGVPQSGITASSMGNQNLKWETTSQLDLGLDAEFFNGRIKATIDFYDKHTRDLLLYANIPYTSGHSKIYKNIGKMSNSGVELSFSTINVQKRRFSWKSDFNISFNRNRINSLNEGETRLLTPISQDWTMSNVNLYMAETGNSAAQFIGLVWDGVYGYDDFDYDGTTYRLKKEIPANGMSRDVIQPGDVKYRDIDGDGTITDKDVVVIGRALPIHFGGFNNEFNLGNFSLSVFLQWSYGNDVMNANRMYLEGNLTNRPLLNQFKSYANRWTPENTESNLFRAGGAGPTGFYSSRTIEDGSFLRLKTVQLSYNFPSRWCQAIRAQRINIYLSGQNLFTWTKYSGMDPEVSVRNSALTPGFDYSAYPRSRTFVFGLKAIF